MGERTKNYLGELARRAPELLIISLVVWMFLNAQEKRDVLIRECTAEMKAVIERNTAAFLDVRVHLERTSGKD